MAVTSATRRDLPIPASPATSAMRLWPPLACVRRSASNTSCASRPIIVGLVTGELWEWLIFLIISPRSKFMALQLRCHGFVSDLLLSSVFVVILRRYNKAPQADMAIGYAHVLNRLALGFARSGF